MIGSADQLGRVSLIETSDIEINHPLDSTAGRTVLPLSRVRIIFGQVSQHGVEHCHATKLLNRCLCAEIIVIKIFLISSHNSFQTNAIQLFLIPILRPF